MYMWMYMKGGAMTEQSVSIAQARSGLPRLIREAEAGGAVEITRRGRPVAVLVSAETYRRLTAGSPSFAGCLDAFLAEARTDEVGLDRDEFLDLRDRGAGRQVRL